MEYQNFSLHHIPSGNEQPYCQQTIERLPRRPVEGDPVAFCAMSNPVDAAERVTLLWSRDNWKTTLYSEASCLGNSDSVGNRGADRYWTAMIPGQSSDDEIVYKLVANSGLSQVSTDDFTFTPLRKIQYKTLSSCEIHEGHVYLIYESGLDDSEKNSPELQICLSCSDEGALSYSFGFDRQRSTEKSCFIIEDEVENDNIFLYKSDGFTLRIEKESGAFSISHDTKGGELYFSGEAEVLQDKNGLWETELFFKALPDEGFYGMGERYNCLNQRGQVLYNRVYEQYTNQRLKTYMPIPFLFTSRQSGIFIDTERNIRFDLCSFSENRWSFRAEQEADEHLRVSVFFGKPARMIRDFTELTGKPAALPDWAFGLWMSANEWNTQKRVEEVAARTEELDIPVKVLVIEAWSDETTFYIWNGANYAPRDPRKAPELKDFDFSQSTYWKDPKGMIEKLHSQGIKLVLWQIPVVKATDDENPQHRLDEEYVKSNGLCAMDEQGEPYKVRPGWFRDSLLADFTNPETAPWWMSRREYLLKEMGVDGFKTDGGEHLWGEGVSFSNGKKGDQMINSYPETYIRAYSDFVRRVKGDEGLTFSRAGYTGIQTSPCHWAGDQNSTWLAYRSAFMAMMNSGLSGIPFIGWDIGGFSGEIPTAELYLRSAAASVFCPIMQYHTENNGWQEPCIDRTPWNIAQQQKAPEVIPMFRKWAKLRDRLLPYIVSEAAYCTETGEPLIRPMLIDFWEDSRARELTDQFLFGRFLLVAPQFSEGALERTVYLPEGLWTDAWTEENYNGPCTINCETPLDSLPLFICSSPSDFLSPGLFDNLK